MDVLVGKPADRFPVAVPYIMLLQCDHWCELTGQPAWTYHDWLIQDPAEHVKVYRDFDQQLPFDILQPLVAAAREQREALEIVHTNGGHFYRDSRSGQTELLDENLHHRTGGPNQKQLVFDKAHVMQHVQVVAASDLAASGRYDYVEAAARAYGNEKFIMNGVVGTFYQCTAYVGETNLFTLLHDAPELIHCLSERILERTIEETRALAAVGHDAIYVDDALTTRDIISRDFYERFSMPYVKVMIDEIHALGKKAVLIYSGGVADRIE